MPRAAAVLTALDPIEISVVLLECFGQQKTAWFAIISLDLGLSRLTLKNGETTWQLAVSSYRDKRLPLKMDLP